MNSIAIRLIVFACVFGGALVGMFLRGVLAEHQLSADSKDTVRMGMGLIGTLTALVLGLLIASAKSYYDTQSSELTEMSAKVVLLDRVLAHYGPETKELRDLLHNAAGRMLDQLWPKNPGQHSQIARPLRSGHDPKVPYTNHTWPDGGQTPFAQSKGTVMDGGARGCAGRDETALS